MGLPAFSEEAGQVTCPSQPRATAMTPCCQLWRRRLGRRTCPSQLRAKNAEIASESQDSHAGVTSAWKRERGDGSGLKRPESLSSNSLGSPDSRGSIVQTQKPF